MALCPGLHRPSQRLRNFFAVAEPASSTEVNAASFDASHDDVFNRIASRYDLLCELFSFFIHRLWNSRMARRIPALPWQCMLDVASGTGDIALRVVGTLDVERGRTCIVSDICPAMLDLARCDERESGWRLIFGDSASDLGASLPNDKMSTVPTGSPLGRDN